MLEYRHALPPLKHQRQIWLSTRDKKDWALFMEMGTGKSKIVIDTIGWRWLKGDIGGAVIFAKKGEYANWHYEQIPTHMSPDVLWRSFLYQGLRTASIRQEAASFLRFPGLKVLVANVEAVNTGDFDEVWRHFEAQTKGRYALIVDESTCIKTPTSKRSGKIYKLARKAEFRRIMTGTAVTQSPVDLFGQCQALDPRLLGYKSLLAFRNEFTNLELQYLGQRVIKRWVGSKNEDKLRRILATFSTQMTKDECLDLPPKLYRRHAVEMTAEQAAAYNQLRSEMLLDYGDEPVLEVVHALTLLTKLHQIACGHVKLESGEVLGLRNNRVSATLDLIESNQKKVIVWATYRHSIEALQQELTAELGEGTVASYYGGTAQNDRKEIVSTFQRPDSRLKVLVANPQSAGFGLTLTAANLAIYFSNSFNLEHRLQSEDRIHRIGQSDSCLYVDLYCPGTVDERVTEVIKGKKSMSEVLIRTSIRNWV